ncbi:MAG: hypothetical protein R8N24_02905 [Alphaproteobacteria bacterium]|nr:hypothetical protein [Alphaproteobacteria bacterium]
MKYLITIVCWFIPIKNVRIYLKNKYVKSKRIKYTNGNKVIVHGENGEIIVNPYSILGLKISFNGHNSIIELYKPIKFYKSEIKVDSNCKITIHKSYQINMLVYAYDDSSIFIDDNVGIGGARIHMMNEKGTSLYIGPDAVLSYDIEIYTTDTHPILDLHGNIINNTKSSVIIGAHTWVGASSVLLKGCQLPENCIIGHSSVVTKKFQEPNTIIAGNPARVVKSNINWRGGTID